MSVTLCTYFTYYSPLSGFRYDNEQPPSRDYYPLQHNTGTRWDSFVVCVSNRDDIIMRRTISLFFISR